MDRKYAERISMIDWPQLQNLYYLQCNKVNYRLCSKLWGGLCNSCTIVCMYILTDLLFAIQCVHYRGCNFCCLTKWNSESLLMECWTEPATQKVSWCFLELRSMLRTKVNQAIRIDDVLKNVRWHLKKKKNTVKKKGCFFNWIELLTNWTNQPSGATGAAFVRSSARPLIHVPLQRLQSQQRSSINNHKLSLH